MTPAMAKEAKKEHTKAPLGSLIKYFEKLSDSPALVASLKKFTKKRNRLAHALLAAALDYEGELDHGKLTH